MKMPHEWVQKAFICVSFRLFLRHVPATGLLSGSLLFPVLPPLRRQGCRHDAAARAFVWRICMILRMAGYTSFCRSAMCIGTVSSLSFIPEL